MKKLERSEMKNLKGGKIAYQSGWTLSGSQCYCDYTYTYPNGSHLFICDDPCPSTCCSSSGYACNLQLSY